MHNNNDQYQANFIAPQPLDLKLDDACIHYFPNFYSNTDAIELYNHLLNNLEWRQETIKVYGKLHLTPRLSCWMGDHDAHYGYSHLVMQPEPWSQLVLKIKDTIERSTNQTFNSVLINYYRNGKDSNGWHSDNEPELGPDPIIASLSLGAARDFHLRHKNRKELKQKISLENGSLLTMGGTTQRYWQHHIPKRAHAQGRINLTFRTIKR